MQVEPVHVNIHPKRLTWTPEDEQTGKAVKAFLDSEPGWIQNAINSDPALKNKGDKEARAELLLYQGLHAIAWHRQAHLRYTEAYAIAGQKNWPLGEKSPDSIAAGKLWDARAISQGVRRMTGGIEIHPGATIGENFFIDHGAGVVIGETAEVGDNAYFYHDVTLGAATNRKGNSLVAETNDFGIPRRHPKIGHHAMLGKGCSLLGPHTIGNHNSIAASAELIGTITTEDNVTIGANVLIKGRLNIEAGVTIGEGAHIIGKDITIGKGAIIDPGVQVTQNVPAGAHVIDHMPKWMAAIGTAKAEEIAGKPVYGKEDKRKGMIFGTVRQVNAAVINGMHTVLRDFLGILGPQPQQR